MSVRFRLIARLHVGAAVILASATVAGAQTGYSYDVVYRSPPPGAANPRAGPIAGADGNLYGTTQLGGASHDGTIFKITPAGAITILRELAGSADGRYPAERLIQAIDGNLYGTTDNGGAAGGGTIFRITPGGAFTVLHAFSSQSSALQRPSALIQARAPDGNFYGTTKGQPGEAGGIFKMTPEGVVNILRQFPASSLEINPNALIQGADGVFYGTTFGRIGWTISGPQTFGDIFTVTTDGTFSVIHSFDSTDSSGNTPGGAHPLGALVQASDNNFYGTTTSHGASGRGTVFRMSPLGIVTTLYSFPASASPNGDLVQASDGNLYGTTRAINDFDRGLGGVFRLTPGDGAVTLLHPFTGDPDGASPYGGLAQASDGALYGTTSSGGASYQYGTVFKISLAGALDVVHSFNLSAAPVQFNGLISGGDGHFYGTSHEGGVGGRGTAFKVTPAGALTVLHAFTRTEGTGPAAALVRASDGNFYGTTEFGGTTGGGTVFRMTPAGAVTILHAFDDASEGKQPHAALIQATNGEFYGTTSRGAISNGTIFKISGAGVLTVLKSYSSAGGRYEAGLLQGADGDFYGTTTLGGPSFYGAVFRMSQAGSSPVTALHGFTGDDGAWSRAPLIQATDGNLYGTTFRGAGPSADGPGVIFRMTPAGAYTVLHRMQPNFADGFSITAPLVQASDGNFYGTAAEGGSFGRGNIFRMAASGTFTIVHHFDDVDGAGPRAGLLEGAGGYLYGTTDSVKNDATGAYAGGMIYRLRRLTAVPPGTPAGLAATPAGFTKIRLRWAAADDATSYNLKRGVTPGVETTVATGVTGTSYSDASVFPGQRYYYVVSAVNSVGESASSAEASATTLTRPAAQDFDGDGKADLTFVRNTTFHWNTLHSGSAFTANTSRQWGLVGDGAAPGDYDGDGIIDPAVYRPSSGMWYGTASSLGGGSFLAVWMGVGGALPVPGDYDGDGRADPAVYSPSSSVWYVLQSTRGYSSLERLQIQWGWPGDVAVPGDYDGDGRTDPAVYRPSNGTWYVLESSTGFDTVRTFALGVRTDQPVPADYDGDGRTDPAIYRPSTGIWQWLRSSVAHNANGPVQWGLPGDRPVPADYDGDGRADPAVYRPSSGTWFVSLSATLYTASFTQAWGQVDAVPLPVIPLASTQSDAQRLSDVDGDVKADLTFFRPSTGMWWTLLSSSNFATSQGTQWGLTDDVPVPGDYDGDRKADRAVFRPSSGLWFVLMSSTNEQTSFTVQWGLSGDTPVPGEFDGDGRTDLAVFRPATGQWFILTSSSNYMASQVIQLGLPGDTPVANDYDGDGRTDTAVFRPANGMWYVRTSSTNFTTVTTRQWGLNGDIPVPGDYDGDGKGDFAIFRPASQHWYLLFSSTNFVSSGVTQWGLPGDLPIPLDYDGDGKMDLAVFRPSTGVWAVLRSSAGPFGQEWGTSTDIPILVRK